MSSPMPTPQQVHELMKRVCAQLEARENWETAIAGAQVESIMGLNRCLQLYFPGRIQCMLLRTMVQENTGEWARRGWGIVRNKVLDDQGNFWCVDETTVRPWTQHVENYTASWRQRMNEARPTCIQEEPEWPQVSCQTLFNDLVPRTWQEMILNAVGGFEAALKAHALEETTASTPTRKPSARL